MSMYRIWKEGVTIPAISDLKRVNAEFVTIKPFEPDVDGYIFLHGVALANFKGMLICAWAHNRVRENSDDETVNYAISKDGGKTWSSCIEGKMAPEKGIAVSHGAFLEHAGQLFFFAPLFKGQLGKEMMKVASYVFDEASETFRFLGVVLEERFWPMCEPILMEDGNYIMPGAFIADDYFSPDNTAAVAISKGGDLMHWEMVSLPFADGVKVWGECSLLVNGAHIKLFCREHSCKYKALFSESFDFGRTWSILGRSDLPMIDSKPYSGTLSDGRNYLLCSSASDIRARDPLTIALTEPGEETFRKIYKIEEGAVLCYPYAIEVDKKLFVAFSRASEPGNRNSAELAIIDIQEFSK